MSLTATVVIATRDRPSELADCLRALAAQDAATPFDVIVVDDGSVPPAQLPAHAPSRVRVIRTSGIGPGQARNAGVAEAAGDVILFTDDDVVVDPAWVSRAVTHLESHPDHAGVEGTVRSRPWDPLYESSIATSAPGHRWTCNVAYRREVLTAVGGFAAGFPAAHCEDRDLGLRVAEHGPIGFDPQMVVTHSPRALSMRQMIRRGRLVASDIELERRHPGVFPSGRVPHSGRLMPPIRLARNWLTHARPGSPYRLRSARRIARFAVVAGGQVLVAAWTAWGPRSQAPPRHAPEVARAPDVRLGGPRRRPGRQAGRSPAAARRPAPRVSQAPHRQAHRELLAARGHAHLRRHDAHRGAGRQPRRGLVRPRLARAAGARAPARSRPRQRRARLRHRRTSGRGRA